MSATAARSLPPVTDFSLDTPMSSAPSGPLRGGRNEKLCLSVALLTIGWPCVPVQVRPCRL
jgi:hypothetical protein